MTKMPRRALGMKYAAPEYNEGAKYKRGLNLILLGMGVLILLGLYFFLLPPEQEAKTHLFVWQATRFDDDDVAPLVKIPPEQIEKLKDSFGWGFDKEKNQIVEGGADTSAVRLGSLEELAEKVKPLKSDDLLILYLRAYLYRSGAEQYIMLQNFDPDSVKDTNNLNAAVSLTDVLENLNGLPCKDIVLLLDWADPELSSKHLEKKPKEDYEVLAALSQTLDQYKKIQVIAAKKDHQPSLCKWKVEKGNAETLFFHTLQALESDLQQNNADLTEGSVTIQTFFDRLKFNMLQRSGGWQTPELLGEHPDLPIAKVKKITTAKPPPTENATVTAAVTPSTQSPEPKSEGEFVLEKNLNLSWETLLSPDGIISEKNHDFIAIDPQWWRSNMRKLRRAESKLRTGFLETLKSEDTQVEDTQVKEQQISSNHYKQWFHESELNGEKDYQYIPDPNIDFDGTRKFVRQFARWGTNYLQWNHLFALYPEGDLQKSIEQHLKQLQTADRFWNELAEDAARQDSASKAKQTADLEKSREDILQAIDDELDLFRSTKYTAWEIHYRAHLLLSLADLSVQQRRKIWNFIRTAPANTKQGDSSDQLLSHQFLQDDPKVAWLAEVNQDKLFPAIVAPAKSDELDLLWKTPNLTKVSFKRKDQSVDLEIRAQKQNGTKPPDKLTIQVNKKSNPEAPITASQNSKPLLDSPNNQTLKFDKGIAKLQLKSTEEYEDSQPVAKWEFSFFEKEGDEPRKLDLSLELPTLNKLEVFAKSSPPTIGSAERISTYIEDSEWPILKLPVTALETKEGEPAKSKFELFLENPSGEPRTLRVAIYRIDSIPNTPVFQLRSGSFLRRFRSDQSLDQSLGLPPDSLRKTMESNQDSFLIKKTEMEVPANGEKKISFEPTSPVANTPTPPPKEDSSEPAKFGLLLTITDVKDENKILNIPIFFDIYDPFQDIKTEFLFDKKNETLSVQLKDLNALWKYCDLKSNGIKEIKLQADIQDTSVNPRFSDPKEISIDLSKDKEKTISFKLNKSHMDTGAKVNIGFLPLSRQGNFIWRQDDPETDRRRDPAAFLSTQPSAPSTPTPSTSSQPPKWVDWTEAKAGVKKIVLKREEGGEANAPVDESKLQFPIQTVFSAGESALFWQLKNPDGKTIVEHKLEPEPVRSTFDVQLSSDGGLSVTNKISELVVELPRNSLNKDGWYKLELYADPVTPDFAKADREPTDKTEVFGDKEPREMIEILIDNTAPKEGQLIAVTGDGIEAGKEYEFEIETEDVGSGVKEVVVGMDGENGGKVDRKFEEKEKLKLDPRRIDDKKWSFTYKFEKLSRPVTLVAQLKDEAGNTQNNVFSKPLLPSTEAISAREKTYRINVSVTRDGSAPSTEGQVTIEGMGTQKFQGGVATAEFKDLPAGEFSIKATTKSSAGEFEGERKVKIPVKGQKEPFEVVIEIQRKKN